MKKLCRVVVLNDEDAEVIVVAAVSKLMLFLHDENNTDADDPADVDADDVADDTVKLDVESRSWCWQATLSAYHPPSCTAPSNTPTPASFRLARV